MEMIIIWLCGWPWTCCKSQPTFAPTFSPFLSPSCHHHRSCPYTLTICPLLPFRLLTLPFYSFTSIANSGYALRLYRLHPSRFLGTVPRFDLPSLDKLSQEMSPDFVSLYCPSYLLTLVTPIPLYSLWHANLSFLNFHLLLPSISLAFVWSDLTVVIGQCPKLSCLPFYLFTCVVSLFLSQPAGQVTVTRYPWFLGTVPRYDLPPLCKQCPRNVPGRCVQYLLCPPKF